MGQRWHGVGQLGGDGVGDGQGRDGQEEGALGRTGAAVLFIVLFSLNKC